MRTYRGGERMNKRKWLVEYRKKHKYSQDQLANILDIPKSTYTSYENGRRTPSVDTSKVLAYKLGIEWTIFFDS